MYTRQQLCNYCTGNGTPFARTNLMQDRLGKLFENRLLYRAGFQIDINKISLKLGKFVYRKKVSNASRRVERGDKEN